MLVDYKTRDIEMFREYDNVNKISSPKRDSRLPWKAKPKILLKMAAGSQLDLTYLYYRSQNIHSVEPWFDNNSRWLQQQ